MAESDLATMLEELGVDANIQEQLESLASACEAKLGIAKKIVYDKYASTVEDLKTKLPQLDEKKLLARAFIITKGYYKRELRSPAKFFEGVILGVNSPFDMVALARRQAAEMYRTDPEKAIKEGWTDAEGNPLDRRTSFGSGRANPNYGKPLPEHSYIQNIFGVCRAQGEKEFVPFKLTLGDQLANKIEIPTMVPVQFRANIPEAQDDPNVRRLNPYTRMTFTPVQVDGFDVETILNDKMLDRYKVELGDLQAYHARVASDPQRIVITQADVQYIDPEVNAVTGNKMMVLDDATLPDDHPGVTAWVPPHLLDAIDFGIGSRVWVIGSTVEAQFNEGPSILINVLGIHAIPEYKVPPDEVSAGIVSKVEQVK